jgi:hypothetical protein
MGKREMVAEFVRMGGWFPDEYLPRLDACPDDEVQLVTRQHYEPGTEQYAGSTTTLTIGAALEFIHDSLRVRDGEDIDELLARRESRNDE